MIDETLIKEAKKRLYTLSLCCLCVETEDEENLKVNSAEITKLIKNNINNIFDSNEKLEALFDKEGSINYEHLHNIANEIAKTVYYKLFNLPYILEINASELCLDTDDIAKDEDKDSVIAKAKEALGSKLSGNIIKEIYVPGRIVNIVAK